MQEVANSAVVAVSDASQALVPANIHVPKDVTLYARKASGIVTKYAGMGQARVDAITGKVRHVSVPFHRPPPTVLLPPGVAPTGVCLGLGKRRTRSGLVARCIQPGILTRRAPWSAVTGAAII